MCGKQKARVQCIVEGTKMNTCRTCSSFGRVLEAAPTPQPSNFSRTRNIPPEESVTDNCAQVIRLLRQRSGMNQKEFAHKIGEKESTLSKIESGSLEVSIPVAKKIEKLYGVTLTEVQTKVAKQATTTRSRVGLTIGDMLKSR